MFENDTQKNTHKNDIQKQHIYDMAEMTSRRSEDAYKSFKRPPYYLEDKEKWINGR